jgi:hypothetical protein
MGLHMRLGQHGIKIVTKHTYSLRARKHKRFRQHMAVQLSAVRTYGSGETNHHEK